MNKTIVITGGAGGLGRAIIKTLSNEQNTIIALDNSQEKLNDLQNQLPCETMLCDITDPSQVKDVIEKIVQQHESIDVLINNAGIWIQGPLSENDDKKISDTFSVNCLGTIYATKYVLPVMQSKNSGTIINIVSMAGLIAKSERSVYNASKWAMTGFTKCLQEDLKGTQISVTGIYPSLINTGLFENAGISRDDLDRGLDPNQIARTINFILSLEPTVNLPEISIKDLKY